MRRSPIAIRRWSTTAMSKSFSRVVLPASSLCVPPQSGCRTTASSRSISGLVAVAMLLLALLVPGCAEPKPVSGNSSPAAEHYCGEMSNGDKASVGLCLTYEAGVVKAGVLSIGEPGPSGRRAQYPIEDIVNGPDEVRFSVAIINGSATERMAMTARLIRREPDLLQFQLNRLGPEGGEPFEMTLARSRQPSAASRGVAADPGVRPTRVVRKTSITEQLTSPPHPARKRPRDEDMLYYSYDQGALEGEVQADGSTVLTQLRASIVRSRPSSQDCIQQNPFLSKARIVTATGDILCLGDLNVDYLLDHGYISTLEGKRIEPGTLDSFDPRVEYFVCIDCGHDSQIYLAVQAGRILSIQVGTLDRLWPCYPVFIGPDGSRYQMPLTPEQAQAIWGAPRSINWVYSRTGPSLLDWWTP